VVKIHSVWQASFAHAALQILKELARKGGQSTDHDASEQLQKLRFQVQQRDNEINILVSMLKRHAATNGYDNLAMDAHVWPDDFNC
jgi:methionine salvage enolase-phosphatase E1